MQQHVSDLLALARDLTAGLAAADRYERLLTVVRRIIPCDAASILRLDGDSLLPLAAHGLVPEALGQRYQRREQPRLDIVCRSQEPVHFPHDSSLPDPFDGLLTCDPGAHAHVHACLGCPLMSEGTVVGVLTADALDVGAFDRVDDELLAMIGALAGAALRTTQLIDTLERVAEGRRQVARQLVREAAQRSGGQLLGRSAPMQRVREEIATVAGTDVPVLITGASGTGKELAARSLHAGSARSEEALIYVNCAALPESIVESELFGHRAGAFSGADRDRAGRFEMADGGTLFLDEIGELPLSVQPKLLRVLQEGELQRVGEDRLLHVDVRIIAATNRDLEQEVAAGRFRADLYHRLAVFPLPMPALSERLDDIRLLAGWFLDNARRRLGCGPLRLDSAARTLLQRQPWPGNVRELDNVLARAALRAAAGAAAGQE
ncbi:MAG: nitric oxide reductase transcriptional regulator NorR, partial [Planctomycetota bacterium]